MELSVDSLIVDFRKLLASYRRLIIRFHYYRFSYQLKLKHPEESSIQQAPSQSNSEFMKIIALLIGFIILVLGIFAYTERIILHYEFR